MKQRDTLLAFELSWWTSGITCGVIHERHQVTHKDLGHTGLSFVSILFSTSHRLGTEHNHCAKTEWNPVEFKWWWLGHTITPPPPKKTKNTTSQTSFDMDNRGKEWGLVRNSCSSSNGHSRAATLSFMVCFHKPIGDIMEATPMPYTAFGNYQN